MPKRRCKQCGDYVTKFIKHPIGVFCTDKHMFDFISDKQQKQRERQLAKAKTAKKKLEKTNKKALIDLNRRTLKWQHKQTQPVFNKLRRLQELKWFEDRGLEPVCISCQKPIGNDQWCNGHLKTVGSNGRLRYDPVNSYLQHNRQCNMGKSGDVANYKDGVIMRFGEDEGQLIIDYCESNNSPIKRSWQDIESMRKEFNRKIRELL